MLHSQLVAGSRGFGVLPKNAFGYPKAMLAKPVTSWENTVPESEVVIFSCFFDSGQTVQCGADDVPLFGHPDFSRHGIADFLTTHHQHPAPAQLLPGNVLKLSSFIGTFQRQILAVGQLWTDRDVSEFINLAAIAFQ